MSELCYSKIPEFNRRSLNFSSTYVPCGEAEGNEGYIAIQRTLEQIDIIYNMIAEYDAISVAPNPAEMEFNFKSNKISAILSIEGGHQINNQLSVLRMYHQLGVRASKYFPLRNTHTSVSHSRLLDKLG